MSDETGKQPCNCGGQGTTTAQTLQSTDALAKVVMAKVSQDHEATFNIRVVPANSLGKVLEVQPKCKPRGHRTGWDLHDAVAISPGLVATLGKANNAMVAWLAKDTANTQRFLANPVAAMREAGVELSRSDEKALSRANAEASAARVVGPGVRIASLSAQTFPNGRVGGIGPSKTDGGGRPGGAAGGGKPDDFDCGPRRKG